jgi:eukaryotic-like serine/threonine-protein kinase
VSLALGSRIGHYEVVSLLGAGGMGEVYRARDSRLNRDVALKVLPEAFADDASRLARFEREAQLLASLNHPNVASIYGVEDGALVLELVDGPTLADRLVHGAIPLDQALTIARQITEALEAAHERGIVHRDLKPANIKIRDDGTVKVLDFGLAKALDTEPSSAIVSQSPTIVSPAMTRVGVILGTAAYMSPEQARGREADIRSDVWAFGCVLYEMLTARRAFGGDEVADTLAAILRAEPDWSRLPADTPAAIRRLLARCLRKESKQRLHDIADARIEIDDVIASPGEVPVTVGSRVGRRWPLTTAAALVGLLIGVVAGWIFGSMRGIDDRGTLQQLSIVAPPGAGLTSDAPQISPDGKTVAFIATDRSGKTLLYVRPLDSTTARPLMGTEEASMPFWSPDSARIGFFAQDQLKTIASDGRDLLVLAPVQVPRGGTWSRDGVILYSPTPLDLRRISANGGASVDLRSTQLYKSGRIFPVFLPDGRHYLYLASSGGIGRTIHVGTLDSAEERELVASDSSPSFTEAGYLLFRRGAALMAQSFDPRAIELSGEPRLVTPNLGINPITGQSLMSTSRDGALVYVESLPRSQMTLVDRTGNQVALVGPPGYRQVFCVTGDDARVVFDEVDLSTRNADVWTLDLNGDRSARGVRLTFDPALDFFPVCPADRNGEVVFTSLRESLARLFRVPINEPGKDQTLLAASIRVPEHRSNDGRWLLYRTIGNSTGWDIWALSIASPDQAVEVAASAAEERDARMSPDGRWIAYASSERGVAEVMVQPFPKRGSTKWQVSDGGGYQPQWSRDGRELFYLRGDKKLMVVNVAVKGESFATGPSTPLFDTNFTLLDRVSRGTQYAVLKNGQQFLINRASDETAAMTYVAIPFQFFAR